jgi:predicted membrane protein
MKHSNKSWIGIGIISIGVVWLLNVLGVPMPEWLFTWPVLLIVIGIFSGLASGFRNMGSVIVIFIGLVFLARDSLWPGIDMGNYLWPVILIFVGVAFLIKRHRWDHKMEWFRQQHPEWKSWHEHLQQQWRQHQWTEPGQPGGASSPLPESGPDDSGTETAEKQPAAPLTADSSRREESASGQDWLDITTVFGGSRRHVISKNFKGGDLINVCGGTEIDMTHADIQGTVTIDVVALWGGIRIAVPPNWQVRMNVTHLMAGTDVRRGNSSALQDPNKVLIFTGTVLMAGIEIRDAL